MRLPALAALLALATPAVAHDGNGHTFIGNVGELDDPEKFRSVTEPATARKDDPCPGEEWCGENGYLTTDEACTAEKRELCFHEERQLIPLTTPGHYGEVVGGMWMEWNFRPWRHPSQDYHEQAIQACLGRGECPEIDTGEAGE